MRDRTAIALMAAPILAAGLLLPGRAEANVSIDVACPSPDRAQALVVLDGHVPGRTISGSLLVTLDGETVHVGTHRFTGPASSVPVALPRGSGRLVAAYAVGRDRWSASADVSCAAPPLPPAPPGEESPPPVAPAPPPPPVATAPPVTRPAIDCAHLRRVGAGRRWLVRFGCVGQPRITCADLRRRGAGPRWYWRLRCPMPITPPPAAPHVPVTG
jgi:hypothetical protein